MFFFSTIVIIVSNFIVACAFVTFLIKSYLLTYLLTYKFYDNNLEGLVIIKHHVEIL